MNEYVKVNDNFDLMYAEYDIEVDSKFYSFVKSLYDADGVVKFNTDDKLANLNTLLTEMHDDMPLRLFTKHYIEVYMNNYGQLVIALCRDNHIDQCIERLACLVYRYNTPNSTKTVFHTKALKNKEHNNYIRYLMALVSVCMDE